MGLTKTASPIIPYQRNRWVPVVLCLLLLFLEIYAYTHNYFMPDLGGLQGDAIPVATLKSAQNDVLHKSDGTLIWKSPEAGNTLYREDAIATMDNAQAVITFADNSDLTIEPNSLVILEMAPTGKGRGGKIVVRLIRGSVKRRSSGPSSLVVKFSSRPDAESAVLDDDQGGAVFRVIHHGWGLQVVVEGGKIKVNNSQVLKAPASTDIPLDRRKLPGPRLKKPTIQIKQQETQNAPSCWGTFFLPCAYAEEMPVRQIEIHFAWEPVPDSSAYVVQIAKDLSFSEIVLEKKVDGVGYTYSFSSDSSSTEFFFRVAALSMSGEQGNYSDPQRVAVSAESGGAPKKSAEKTRSLQVKKHGAIPAPPKVEAARPTRHGPKPWIAEAALGLLIHQRQFKSTSNPQSASGSGFVPGRLRAEGYTITHNFWVYSVGGSYLFEVAEPKLPVTKATGTPLWRAWFLAGGPWNSLLFSAGPYATNSSTLRFSGLDLIGRSKILLGALAKLSPHPDTLTDIHWSLELGLIGLGSPGADLNFTFQQPLSSFWHLEPYKASEKKGYFWGAAAMVRWITMERSFGAALEVGRYF